MKTRVNLRYFVSYCGLAFYGNWKVCLPGCVGIVNAGWLCSMRSEIFLQKKCIIFQDCPNKLPFYLGSLLHIIGSLFSHFRSWDYPEHVKIDFQLDRKSKTWLFIFLSVYASEIEWEKILILQLSPPKFFGISATRMDQRGTTWKWILTISKCKNEVLK